MHLFFPSLIILIFSLFVGEVITDSNFDEVFDDVLQNLKDCKYKNLAQTMLIASIILYLQKENLITKSLDELYRILKMQIDYIFKNELVGRKSILNEDYIKRHRPSYDHLAFNINFSEYEEINKYIEEKVKKEKENIFIKSYDEIEDALRNNHLDLYKLLSHSNNREELYCDKPIFAFMDMNKLAKLLIESSSDSQYTFGGILEDRYEHDFFASKLEDEFGNVYRLKELIEAETEKKEGKISGYRLKRNLIEPLEKAIEDIENYKNTLKGL